MRPLRLPAAALLVLAAACLPPEPVDADPPGAPCRVPSFGTLVVADRDLGLAPGESHTLLPPEVVYGPMGPRPVDDGCPVHWSVEGSGGRVDDAGRLSIASDARPGDSFFVVLNAMGATARRMVRVVDPAPNPLAGKWRQDPAAGCVGPQGPVGELEFRRTGDLLLTFRPFESYVDVAGTYAWDRETGRLVLRSNTRAVSDGVFLEGRAGVEGGRLFLEVTPAGDQTGIFGAGMREGGCRAVFGSFDGPR